MQATRFAGARERLMRKVGRVDGESWLGQFGSSDPGRAGDEKDHRCRFVMHATAADVARFASADLFVTSRVPDPIAL